MVEWLLVSFQTACLLVILAVAILNVFYVADLGDLPSGRGASVSLLIPARNEARNIEHAIECALAQDYPDLEVLALDDGSEDATWCILERLAARHPELRIARGQPLPEGWLGKSFACHQLQRRARGEVLVFMDADVRPAPEAVARTIGAMCVRRLDLLSVFPRQRTETLAERLAVPLISLVLYGLLPFPCLRRSRHPAFSAASGQWLAITRSAYRRTGGHEAVRGEVLEDIELTRNARRCGLCMDLLAGGRLVGCRMYRSHREVFDGLSKNSFASARYSLPGFSLFLLFMVTVFLAPFLLAGHPSFWLPIGLVLLIKLLLGLRFGHGLVTFVLLHPISIAYGVLIALNSIRWHYGGGGHWKGRALKLTADS